MKTPHIPKLLTYKKNKKQTQKEFKYQRTIMSIH